MDATKILEYLLGTSPLAAVMFWLFWQERKERRDMMAKLEAAIEKRVTDSQGTSERLIKLADSQREAIVANTVAVTMLRDSLFGRTTSQPELTGGGRR